VPSVSKSKVKLKCLNIKLLNKHIYVILYKCYLVWSRILKLFLPSHEGILYKGRGVNSPITLLILNLYTKWDESVTLQTLHLTFENSRYSLNRRLREPQDLYRQSEQKLVAYAVHAPHYGSTYNATSLLQLRCLTL